MTGLQCIDVAETKNAWEMKLLKVWRFSLSGASLRMLNARDSRRRKS